MNNSLMLLIFLAVYILLMKFILPRAGVPT